jgi:hypothetical protein
MKTENNQKKRVESTGKNQTIPVNWRCPNDLYQLIEKYRDDIEIREGYRIPVSKVLEKCVKKTLS